MRKRKIREAAVVRVARTRDNARNGDVGAIVAATIANAAAAICRKPSRADAEPARSPKGDNVRAVPIGLTIPIPNRKTSIGSR